MGNRYLGASPSTRETAKIAWRERVNAAARQLAKYPSCRPYDWSEACPRCFEGEELDCALSAPRPWRSTRKPTPRRRYSRAHRRGCPWCFYSHMARTVLPRWDERARDLWSPDCPKTFDEVRGNVARIAQDPHGRRA